MRIWKLVGFVLTFAFALAACSHLHSPTGPSDNNIPPTVQPPVISIPPGATLNESDPITVAIPFNPGTGSMAVAWVLVRDDGAALNVACGAGSGSGLMGDTIVLKGAKYLWAKGHILNGATLEADFDDPNAALQGHGCYFLDANQDPFSVHFERATKRTDTALNWRVM